MSLWERLDRNAKMDGRSSFTLHEHIRKLQREARGNYICVASLRSSGTPPLLRPNDPPLNNLDEFHYRPIQSRRGPWASEPPLIRMVESAAAKEHVTGVIVVHLVRAVFGQTTPEDVAFRQLCVDRIGAKLIEYHVIGTPRLRTSENRDKENERRRALRAQQQQQERKGKLPRK